MINILLPCNFMSKILEHIRQNKQDSQRLTGLKEEKDLQTTKSKKNIIRERKVSTRLKTK